MLRKNNIFSFLPQLPEPWKRKIVLLMPLVVLPEIIFDLLKLLIPSLLQNNNNWQVLGFIPIVDVASFLLEIPLIPLIFGIVVFGGILKQEFLVELAENEKFLYIMPIILGLVLSYLLFRRKRIAWLLLIISSIILLSVTILSVLSGDLRYISSVVSSIISLYILLQIRKYYS